MRRTSIIDRLCLSILLISPLLVARPLAAQRGEQPFRAFEQKIPGTSVSFTMAPIPGNKALDSFWMEEHEVTYEEYILFQDETQDPVPVTDGITRPSPPYIDFTLGMGKKGGFPANSMSQYAAIM